MQNVRVVMVADPGTSLEKAFKNYSVKKSLKSIGRGRYSGLRGHPNK
jgi:hypothetical protein